MKVFIVTSGGFDLCDIVGVTSVKEIAEEFIKVCQETGCIPEINSLPEEYELNQISSYTLRIKNGYTQMHVRLYHNGQFVVTKVKKICLKSNKFAHLDGYDYGLVWARTSEEALSLVKEYSKYIEKER